MQFIVASDCFTQVNTGKNVFIGNLIRRSAKQFRKFIEQLSHKHLAFFFFVFLSTIAWFLRALSDEYIATIEYPVKYINLPKNRILSKPPPQKLNLQIQADGYTILSSRIKYKRPLNYNVNAFALYSLSEDSTSVYTLTWYAKERLAAELNLLNKNIRILDIKPDTLIFNFTRVKKKKVPVVARLDETPDLFQKQFMLNGIITTEPDSIDVTGPLYMLDTLKQIYTEPVSFKNLSDTAVKKVPLKRINRLSYATKKVKVIVPVDEFTEANFSIPIEHHNVPDSLIIKTFPNSVHVKYLVTLTHFERISSDLIHAYVDFSAVDLTKPSPATRLRVELDTIPSFIYNLNVSPRNVEFLVEKKNAETRNNRGDR
jgi:hypothetical protein